METLFEISVQDLHQLIEAGEECYIIDVRTSEEIKKAAFPKATHIPLSELATSVVNIPQDKLVITVCHHGARSLKACYLLKERGFDKVLSLRGGIDLWSKIIDLSIPQY